MRDLFIFGDSILKGVYFSDECGKHKLVREQYAPLEEAGFCLHNHSLMGATVDAGLAALQKRCASIPTGENSPVILLEFGGNDCDYRWEEISASPDSIHEPKTPMEKFRNFYGQLIEYARSFGAKVYLCNLVPLDAPRYMEWISRNLDKDAILRWLGDPSMLYRWQEYYNRTAEQIAAAFSCPLIDIRSLFLMSHSYSGLLSTDGIHPTVEGHRLIGEKIAGCLV
ncbi:MAG: SGNH/GDSL hydrolase family protein [Ruminococcaceae bacterium]|nr:SGNH/GDSL hydrolase family protein [Oscillospiraceae bacterium]